MSSERVRACESVLRLVPGNVYADRESRNEIGSPVRPAEFIRVGSSRSGQARSAWMSDEFEGLPQ
jgi:hypothetical protein